MSRFVSSFLEERDEREGNTIVVTRPSATALLCIDSDDRYANYGVRRTSPTYPFSFNIQKNESILNGFFRRLALTEFRLNWTLPNIAQAWENDQLLFKWKLSGTAQTDITITLSDGFYNAETIAEAIQTQIRNSSSSLALFSVSTFSNSNNQLSFYAPDGTNVTFILSPTITNSNTRQLFDMLNIPTTSNYETLVYTGIPDLRATDYIDIVCSQLSYNQKLKDATSAAINRNMISRIYMDESVPSRAIFTTNQYSTTTSSYTPTALFGSLVGNTATFVVSTAPTNFVVGEKCSITGITGSVFWNGPAYITAVDTASPYSVTVAYEETPSGTPTFSGTPSITSRNLSYVLEPQTEWDDRVNQVTPFVIYRQFTFPKQIRWSKDMPIGNLQFELYDDQGRSLQTLWSNAYGPVSATAGSILNYVNSTSWNATLLVSED